MKTTSTTHSFCTSQTLGSDVLGAFHMLGTKDFKNTSSQDFKTFLTKSLIRHPRQDVSLKLLDQVSDPSSLVIAPHHWLSSCPKITVQLKDSKPRHLLASSGLATAKILVRPSGSTATEVGPACRYLPSFLSQFQHGSSVLWLKSFITFHKWLSGRPETKLHYRPKLRQHEIHSPVPIVLQRFEDKAIEHPKSKLPCPASSFDHSSSSSKSLVSGSLQASHNRSSTEHWSNLPRWPCLLKFLRRRNSSFSAQLGITS